MTFARAALKLALTFLGWLTGNGRWKWAVAALTVALTAFLIHQVRVGHAREKTLSEAVAVAQGEAKLLKDARDADDAALLLRSNTTTDINTKEAKALVRTEAAIAANPDWANEPVPADVADSLRDTP